MSNEQTHPKLSLFSHLLPLSHTQTQIPNGVIGTEQIFSIKKVMDAMIVKVLICFRMRKIWRVVVSGLRNVKVFTLLELSGIPGRRKTLYKSVDLQINKEAGNVKCFPVVYESVFVRLCLPGQEAGQSKRQHRRQCCVVSLCQSQRGPWHPCRLPISAAKELSRLDSTAAHSKLT